MSEPTTTLDAAEAMTERPHPKDYWIVSNYRYKPWPTPEAALGARDKLAAQFPKKRFHVIHCKRRLQFSNSGETIAALLDALGRAEIWLSTVEGSESIRKVCREAMQKAGYKP